MSDIFISYVHHDRPHAEALARALEAAGWTVWWDRTIPAGRNFDQVIEEALNGTKVVLVLWSRGSAESRWVLNEAEGAAARNILVPVVIEENVRIPPAFRRIQAANLVGWDGSQEAPAFHDLVSSLGQHIGGRLGSEHVQVPKRVSVDTDTYLAGQNNEASCLAVQYAGTLSKGQRANLGAYLFAASALAEVSRDWTARSRSSTSPLDVAMGSGKRIARGAEVIVTVDIPDVDVRPRQSEFRWVRDWHRVDFELDYRGEGQRPERGAVYFHVGLVCIGRVSFSVLLTDAPATAAAATVELETGSTYEKVFVSYAHEDVDIVESLEAAYKALGIAYLRDVTTLRSGMEWSPALMQMIDAADLFQLCWSQAAKSSTVVEREWRHALGLRRQEFIRPLFWQHPMAEPPKELKALHFAELSLPHKSWLRRAVRRLRNWKYATT